ncbi:hypothetical protein IAE29_03780 [Ochrobactrum sp. S46]|nr:hypothetical protein [Ochrobactrum sp. S45]MBK0042439.1 hypothetical protein [Ochrobactrum sp. S46]
MTSDSVVKLRISIWKDYAPPRNLVIHDLEILKPLGRDDNLQQEIFSWQVREDPLAGVADDELREQLRASLFDAFNPSLPPVERRFSKLEIFFRNAEKAVESGSAEWTISQDSPSDDEGVSLINPLLALKLQLDWLHQSFSKHPGVSVSIR